MNVLLGFTTLVAVVVVILIFLRINGYIELPTFQRLLGVYTSDDDDKTLNIAGEQPFANLRVDLVEISQETFVSGSQDSKTILGLAFEAFGLVDAWIIQERVARMRRDDCES